MLCVWFKWWYAKGMNMTTKCSYMNNVRTLSQIKKATNWVRYRLLRYIFMIRCSLMVIKYIKKHLFTATPLVADQLFVCSYHKWDPGHSFVARSLIGSSYFPLSRQSSWLQVRPARKPDSRDQRGPCVSRRKRRLSPHILIFRAKHLQLCCASIRK